MKICILVLAHKEIDQIYNFALNNPHMNFYIHFDLKFNISENAGKNIFFVSKRIDVKWGGYSMVQATLNLIEYALQHDSENEFFHLISGDDVFLSNNLIWNDSSVYMECFESKKHRYRLRFNTPHADTQHQRKIWGKLLTQFYKILDKIFPTQEKIFFGSQWFSIRRDELKILMNAITEKDIEFFRKKLCPDEHFFQYLVNKCNMLNHIYSKGNQRYIIFDKNYQRGSSPIFLNYEQLMQARESGYWFARKVEPMIMYDFYSN